MMSHESAWNVRERIMNSPLLSPIPSPKTSSTSPSSSTTTLSSPTCPQDKNFLTKLTEFLHSRNVTFSRIPTLGHKELDLEQLYREVTGRGGVNQVIENKQWHNVVRALKLPSTCTNAAYALRVHYMKFLAEYEKFNFVPSTSAEDDEDDLTEPDSDSSSSPNTSNTVDNSNNNSNKSNIVFEHSSLKDKHVTRKSTRTMPQQTKTDITHIATNAKIKKQRKNIRQKKQRTMTKTASPSSVTTIMDADELERECANQMYQLYQNNRHRERISYQYHSNGVVSVTVDESFDDEFDLDGIVESDEEDDDEEMIDYDEEIIIVSDEVWAKSNLSGLSGKTDISQTTISSIMSQHPDNFTIFSIDPHTMNTKSSPPSKKDSISIAKIDIQEVSDTNWKQILESSSIEELRKLRRYFNINSVTSSSTRTDLLNAIVEYFSRSNLEDGIFNEFQQVLLGAS
jgi:hypothetical protein